MPFVKTEVDIKTDYTVESVDPEWLKQGVKSPKHLMLDPEPCILCRACEDVCPWNCIFMLDPGIVQDTENEAIADEACTRCSVCVERCPSDCLYYARLPEDSGGRRTMGAVPTSQRQPESA